MSKKVDLRGLNYRVIEKEIDGKTQWVAQRRTKDDVWKDCHDKNGDLVARDSASSARHWFFWEDGAEKYPDAGQGEQYVYRFRKDGTRIPEEHEKEDEEFEKWRKANEEKKAHLRGLKLEALKQEHEFPPKRELFVCDCGDISHQFVISMDTISKDWEYVGVEVKLNRNLPWYKRLVVAFRYLFRMHPSRFGDYDEVILNKHHAPQLQNVVDELLKLGDSESENGEED